MIKIRLTELVVILSRAAAEAGVDASTLLMLNREFIQAIENADSYDRLCKRLIEAMKAFMSCVSELKTNVEGDYVTQCRRIVQSRFKENITLFGIAEELHVSPYYLSHNFKEKTGCNFVEYLTRVRMEEASWLLRNTELSVGNIAAMVGYENPGYFSRVFKTYHTLTPEQYRRNGRKSNN